jgi:rubrerythrin
MGEFSVAEVLEFAIAQEVKANHLYKRLAEKARSDEVRGKLEALAAQELEHKRHLEAQLARDIGMSGELNLGNYEVEGEAALDWDFKDVLAFAIEEERSGLHLYLDLSRIVDDDVCHDVLLDLADEEGKHRVELEIEYDKLMEAEAAEQD